MAQQFGEKVSDTTAYAQARSATAYMPTSTLKRMAGDAQNGANQEKAVRDELNSRSTS
jgi:hypothetical protein